MTILFVTGTDTGVGKTVVTAALAAIHRGQGDSVAVVKPAQTGVEPGGRGDLQVVRDLAGDVTALEGVRLRHALAPDTAAQIDGAELPDRYAHRELILDAAGSHDVVLVEGTGGVTVNLGVDFNLLDVAQDVQDAGLRPGWVVVVRAALGTLNHTNLTVWALQQRGFLVQGLVIGSWPDQPGLAERHNRDDLPRHSGVRLLGAVPEAAPALPPETFRSEAPAWIPSIRWD